MISFGFLGSAILKDLRRRLGDPLSIVLWLAIPLFVGSLVTLITSGDGGGPRPKGILLITDKDDSLISGFVSNAFQQQGLADMITVEAVTEEAGSTRVEAGEASAWLLIPEGFGDAVINETPTKLILKTNPSQQILPGLILEAVKLLADAGFYAQQIFGEELRQILRQAERSGDTVDTAVIARVSGQIAEKIESFADLVFPPAITVSMPAPEPKDEPGMQSVSFGLLFLPGVIIMGLMFAAGGIADDWWTEREQGTLKRLRTTPRSMVGLVFAKALSAAVLLAAIAGVLLALGFAYHGIGWGLFLPAVAWAALSGICLYLMLTILNTLATNRRGASLIVNLITLPLLMVGGSFFPFAAMPRALAAIGQNTPNGFMTISLSDYLTSGDLSPLLAASPVLAGTILVLLGLCAWRISGQFSQRQG